MDSSSTIFFYDSDSDISTQPDETLNIINITQRAKRLYHLTHRIHYRKTWVKFANKIRLKAQIRIANKLFKLNFGFDILKIRYKSKYYHRWKRRTIFISMLHKLLFQYRINNLRSIDNELSLEYIQDYKEKWQKWSNKILTSTRKMQLAEIFHRKTLFKQFFYLWLSQFETRQITNNELRNKWFTLLQNLLYQNTIFTAYQLKWQFISHKLVMKNMSDFYNEEKMRNKWIQFLHQYYFHVLINNLTRNQARLSLRNRWIQITKIYRLRYFASCSYRSKLPSLFSEYIRMRKQKKLYEMNQKLISTKELYASKIMCKKIFANWYNAMIISKKADILYNKALNSSCSQFMLKVANDAARTIQKLCRFHLSKLNFRKQLKKWKLFEYWHFKTCYYKKIYPKIKVPSFVMDVELNDLCFDKFPFVFTSNFINRIDFVKDVFDYKKTKEFTRADIIPLNRIQGFDISRSINSLMYQSNLSLSFLLTKNNEDDVIRPNYKPNNVRFIDRVTSRIGEKFDFNLPLFYISKSSHTPTLLTKEKEQVSLPNISFRQSFVSKKRFRFKLLLSYQDVSVLSNFSKKGGFNDYVKNKTSSLLGSISLDENLSSSSDFLFQKANFSLFELKAKNFPKPDLPLDFSIDFNRELNFNIYQFKKNKRKSQKIGVNLFEFPQIQFNTSICNNFSKRIKENASNCAEAISQRFTNDDFNELTNVNALIPFDNYKLVKIPVIENVKIPISTFKQFKVISVPKEIVKESGQPNLEQFSSIKEKIDLKAQKRNSRIENISKRLIDSRYSSILSYDFAKFESNISNRISEYQRPSLKNTNQIDRIIPKFDFDKPIHFLSNDVSNSIPDHFQLNEKFILHPPEPVIKDILSEIENEIVNEYPINLNNFLFYFAKMNVKHQLNKKFRIDFDDELDFHATFLNTFPNKNLRMLHHFYKKEVHEQKIDFMPLDDLKSFPVSVQSKSNPINNFTSIQKPNKILLNLSKAFVLRIPESIYKSHENKIIHLRQVNDLQFKICSYSIVNKIDFELYKELGLQNKDFSFTNVINNNLKSLNAIHMKEIPLQNIDFQPDFQLQALPTQNRNQLSLFVHFISTPKLPKCTKIPQSLLPLKIASLKLKFPDLLDKEKQSKINSVCRINDYKCEIDSGSIINDIDFELNESLDLQNSFYLFSNLINVNLKPFSSIKTKQVPSQKIDFTLPFNFQIFIPQLKPQSNSIDCLTPIQNPNKPFSLFPEEKLKVKLKLPDFLSKSKRGKVSPLYQFNMNNRDFDSDLNVDEIKFEFDSHINEILLNDNIDLRSLQSIQKAQIPSQDINISYPFDLRIILPMKKPRFNSINHLKSIKKPNKLFTNTKKSNAFLHSLLPSEKLNIKLNLPDFIFNNRKSKISPLHQINENHNEHDSKSEINEIDSYLERELKLQNDNSIFENDIDIDINSNKPQNLFNFQFILPSNIFNSIFDLKPIQYSIDDKSNNLLNSILPTETLDIKLKLPNFRNRESKINRLYQFNMNKEIDSNLNIDELDIEFDSRIKIPLFNDGINIGINLMSLQSIQKAQIPSQDINVLYPFNFQIILPIKKPHFNSINQLKSIKKPNKLFSHDKKSNNVLHSLLPSEKLNIKLKLPDFIFNNRKSKISPLHQFNENQNDDKYKINEIDSYLERELNLQNDNSIFENEIDIDINSNKPQNLFDFQFILPSNLFNSIFDLKPIQYSNKFLSIDNKSNNLFNSILPTETLDIKLKLPDFIFNNQKNKVNPLHQINNNDEIDSKSEINGIDFYLERELNLLNENSLFENEIKSKNMFDIQSILQLNYFNSIYNFKPIKRQNKLFQIHDKSNDLSNSVSHKELNIQLNLPDFISKSRESKIDPLLQFNDSQNKNFTNIEINEIDFNFDKELNYRLFDDLVNVTSLSNNLLNINQSKSFSAVNFSLDEIKLPISLLVDKSMLNKNRVHNSNKLLSFELFHDNLIQNQEEDVSFAIGKIFNKSDSTIETNSSKDKNLSNSIDSAFNKMNFLFCMLENYLPNSLQYNDKEIPELNSINYCIDLDLIDIKPIISFNFDKIFNLSSRTKAIENISLQKVSSSISESISKNFVKSQKNILGSLFDQVDLRSSSIGSDFDIVNSVESFMKFYSNDLNSNFNQFLTNSSSHSKFDLLFGQPEIRNNSIIDVISSISDDLNNVLFLNLTKSCSDSLGLIDFAMINHPPLTDVDEITSEFVDDLTFDSLFHEKQSINFIGQFNHLPISETSKEYDRNIPVQYEHRFQFPSTNEMTSVLSDITINLLNQLLYYEYRIETRNEQVKLSRQSSKSLIDDLSFIFIGRFVNSLASTLNNQPQIPDLIQLKYEQEPDFEIEKEIKEPDHEIQAEEVDKNDQYLLPNEIIDKCITKDIQSVITLQSYSAYFPSFFPSNYLALEEFEKEEKRLHMIHFERRKEKRVLDPESRINRNIRSGADQTIIQLLNGVFLQSLSLDINLIPPQTNSESDDKNGVFSIIGYESNSDEFDEEEEESEYESAGGEEDLEQTIDISEEEEEDRYEIIEEEEDYDKMDEDLNEEEMEEEECEKIQDSEYNEEEQIQEKQQDGEILDDKSLLIEKSTEMLALDLEHIFHNQLKDVLNITIANGVKNIGIETNNCKFTNLDLNLENLDQLNINSTYNKEYANVENDSYDEVQLDEYNDISEIEEIGTENHSDDNENQSNILNKSAEDAFCAQNESEIDNEKQQIIELFGNNSLVYEQSSESLASDFARMFDHGLFNVLNKVIENEISSIDMKQNNLSVEEEEYYLIDEINEIISKEFVLNKILQDPFRCLYSHHNNNVSLYSFKQVEIPKKFINENDSTKEIVSSIEEQLPSHDVPNDIIKITFNKINRFQHKVTPKSSLDHHFTIDDELFGNNELKFDDELFISKKETIIHSMNNINKTTHLKQIFERNIPKQFEHRFQFPSTNEATVYLSDISVNQLNQLLYIEHRIETRNPTLKLTRHSSKSLIEDLSYMFIGRFIFNLTDILTNNSQIPDLIQLKYEDESKQPTTILINSNESINIEQDRGAKNESEYENENEYEEESKNQQKVKDSTEYDNVEEDQLHKDEEIKNKNIHVNGKSDYYSYEESNEEDEEDELDKDEEEEAINHKEKEMIVNQNKPIDFDSYDESNDKVVDYEEDELDKDEEDNENENEGKYSNNEIDEIINKDFILNELIQISFKQTKLPLFYNTNNCLLKSYEPTKSASDGINFKKYLQFYDNNTDIFSDDHFKIIVNNTKYSSSIENFSKYKIIQKSILGQNFNIKIDNELKLDDLFRGKKERIIYQMNSMNKFNQQAIQSKNKKYLNRTISRNYLLNLLSVFQIKFHIKMNEIKSIQNYNTANLKRIYERNIPKQFEHRFQFPSTNEATVYLSDISVNQLNQLLYYEHRIETRNPTLKLTRHSSKSLIEDLSYMFIGRFIFNLTDILTNNSQIPDLIQLKYEDESKQPTTILINSNESINIEQDRGAKNESEFLSSKNEYEEEESTKNQQKTELNSKEATDYDSYEESNEENEEDELDKDEEESENQNDKKTVNKSKEPTDYYSYDESNGKKDVDEEDELDKDEEDELDKDEEDELDKDEEDENETDEKYLNKEIEEIIHKDFILNEIVQESFKQPKLSFIIGHNDNLLNYYEPIKPTIKKISLKEEKYLSANDLQIFNDDHFNSLFDNNIKILFTKINKFQHKVTPKSSLDHHFTIDINNELKFDDELFINKKETIIHRMNNINNSTYLKEIYERNIPKQFEHRFQFPSTNEATVYLSDISINQLNQLLYYEHRIETRNPTLKLTRHSSKSLIEDLSYMFIGRFIFNLTDILTNNSQIPDLIQLKHERKELKSKSILQPLSNKTNKAQEIDNKNDEYEEDEEEESQNIKSRNNKSKEESPDDDSYDESNDENQNVKKQNNKSKESTDDESYDVSSDENQNVKKQNNKSKEESTDDESYDVSKDSDDESDQKDQVKSQDNNMANEKAKEENDDNEYEYEEEEEELDKDEESQYEKNQNNKSKESTDYNSYDESNDEDSKYEMDKTDDDDN